MLYIFDMGGVLLHNVFELSDILDAHSCDIDIATLYRDDVMDAYSSGKITEDEYWTLFNKRYGTDIKAPQWGRYFNPLLDLDMVTLINELKSNNRVVCGSNSMDAHYDFSVKRGDYNCFDKVYVSQKMGVSKPDPLFWEIILKEEGYKVEDVVFIDDFSENVAAAENLGIKSILFKDIQSLKAAISLAS